MPAPSIYANVKRRIVSSFGFVRANRRDGTPSPKKNPRSVFGRPRALPSSASDYAFAVAAAPPAVAGVVGVVALGFAAADFLPRDASRNHFCTGSISSETRLSPSAALRSIPYVTVAHFHASD